MPLQLLDISIEPKLRSDAEKFADAISELNTYDPMLSFLIDTETGQAIMHGMNEAHLDGHIDMLQYTYQIEIVAGAIQIAYRETLGATAEISYTHKKQFGSTRQYADLKITFQPLVRNAGIVFENKIGWGALPRDYVAAIERGIRVQAQVGVLAGFPTVDFKFMLIDAKHHDLDSSALAFEIAAKACFRELRKSGQPRILEPIMKIDILTPHDFSEKIVKDLIKRRGRICKLTKLTRMEIVTALVPLKETLAYDDALKRLSERKARLIMQYANHEFAPWPDPPDDLFPPAMAMRA